MGYRRGEASPEAAAKEGSLWPLKMRDEVSDWSALSNGVKVTTKAYDHVPPAMIKDLETPRSGRPVGRIPHRLLRLQAAALTPAPTLARCSSVGRNSPTKRRLCCKQIR